MSYDVCTQVTPQCPVTDTTLGYYPNLGANIFFAVMFGLCTLVTFTVGVTRKTWTFAFAVTAGFAMETVGELTFSPELGWDWLGFRSGVLYILMSVYRLHRPHNHAP